MHHRLMPKFALAVATALIAFAAQAAEVKNIVIVHGALADGSAWRRATDILESRGFNVTIVQEPITSLADDVAATNRVLDLQQGPSLLVGHSYSGMVISEAGNRPDVAGLVYVAAFQPEKGESLRPRRLETTGRERHQADEGWRIPLSQSRRLWTRFRRRSAA